MFILVISYGSQGPSCSVRFSEGTVDPHTPQDQGVERTNCLGENKQRRMGMCGGMSKICHTL